MAHAIFPSEETYNLPRPSSPLLIGGFDRDAACTINAVRGMTFMQKDDEDFCACQIAPRKAGVQ